LGKEPVALDKYEFINPAKYGYGIEWPIGYERDCSLGYSHVESFAGICEQRDGVESMPDVVNILPPFERFNC